MMAEDIRKVFVQNLRRHMNAQGKTQADIARAFGISTATAHDWYHGVKIPRADKLHALAEWLGVGLGDLLMESVPENGQQMYYLDDETAQVANEILNDSNMRILFDAAKGSDPEALQMAAAMLKKMKGNND